MKIALSGTHYSGKTTLGQALAEALDGFGFVDEPYHQMERDGYAFAAPPTVDDFWEQLQVSVASITAAGPSTIFDRSPLDFLAYALSLKDKDPIDLHDWLGAAQEGLQQLSLIVFCPLESPDRIGAPESEDRRLRKAVDRHLKDIILDDRYAVLSGINVVEVRGDPDRRLATASASRPARRLPE